MTVPSVHCEAKLHAFRKTQEGVVVSFVIHPAEVPERVALDPLGTRYMLALAAIGDDEQPARPAFFSPGNSDDHNEPGFIKRDQAKARYNSQTEMEKARDRAGMLPADPRFRRWVAIQMFGENGLVRVADGDMAADYIREQCLAIETRADIAKLPRVYEAFLKLETEYKLASGQMAQPR